MPPHARGRAPLRTQWTDARPHRQRQGTLLVVEDNPDTRASLRDALERDGFDVFATDDGRDAIDRLRSAPMPRALLLDLYMPGFNGFEIYRVLHEDPQLATVPVIIVTAAPPDDRTGLEVAATIRKPLDMQELLFTVRRAIGRADFTPPPDP